MPKINIPGRGPPKEPVPVEEAVSSSTVPSTTQHYVTTNRPDITTQNHSFTETISPLHQQANDSNETVAIVCVPLVILFIVVIVAIIVYVYVIKRKRRKNLSQEATVDVSLTDLDTPEDLNDTQVNTSATQLLNTDGKGACAENGYLIHR